MTKGRKVLSKKCMFTVFIIRMIDSSVNEMDWFQKHIEIVNAIVHTVP